MGWTWLTCVELSVLSLALQDAFGIPYKPWTAESSYSNRPWHKTRDPALRSAGAPSVGVFSLVLITSLIAASVRRGSYHLGQSNLGLPSN